MIEGNCETKQWSALPGKLNLTLGWRSPVTVPSVLAHSLLPIKWLSSKGSRDASTRLACRIEGGLDGSTGHPWRIESRCRHRWKISCEPCRSVALVRFRGSGSNEAVTKPGVCGFVCTQLASPAALEACNSLFHPAIYGQPPAQVKGAAVGPAAHCKAHCRMSQHLLIIRLELVPVGKRKREQMTPYQEGFAVVTIRVSYGRTRPTTKLVLCCKTCYLEVNTQIHLHAAKELRAFHMMMLTSDIAGDVAFQLVGTSGIGYKSMAFGLNLCLNTQHLKKSTSIDSHNSRTPWERKKCRPLGSTLRLLTAQLSSTSAPSISSYSTLARRALMKSSSRNLSVQYIHFTANHDALVQPPRGA
jgi:hypothetical protein